MNALPMSACTTEAREPCIRWAGLSKGSFASSEPILYCLNLEVVGWEAESHVPLSVRVYSESKDAASRASRGNRGYWWYHFE